MVSKINQPLCCVFYSDFQYFTGLAQMTDFILAVKSVSPGAILLEVNMAGTKPGDVGFFNIHFPLVGTITKPSSCTSNVNCPTNHISVHLTPSSSVYWENTWVSDAGGSATNSNNGGGFLIESQGGSWISGVGSGKCSILKEGGARIFQLN